MVSPVWAVSRAFVAQSAETIMVIRARQQIPRVSFFILFVPFFPFRGWGLYRSGNGNPLYGVSFLKRGKM
jgi:hypothetical protein